MRDYETENKSFIEVSNVLIREGIKNFDFMLELIDESLQSIDPYSDNLTNEVKAKIYIECVKNPWYFIREVVRIPVPGYAKGIRYVANLGNMSSTYLKLNDINQILSLPRQHGKLYSNIIVDLWYMYFGASNVYNIYSDREFRDSKYSLKTFSDVKNSLPEYLLDLVQDKKDRNNVEYKYSHLFNNSIKAVPGARTKEQSEKLGCGITSSMVFLNEFSDIKFNKNIYEAIVPAWNVASQNAKENDVPYSISISLQGGYLDTDEGKYAYKLTKGALPFRLNMFDLTIDELKKELKEHQDSKIEESMRLSFRSAHIDETPSDFIYIEFTWKELGKDQEWYDKMCRNFNYDWVKIARELNCEWVYREDQKSPSEEELWRKKNARLEN